MKMNFEKKYSYYLLLITYLLVTSYYVLYLNIFLINNVYLKVFVLYYF